MATHMFPSCFIRILQVFQLFRVYVVNVSCRCCKNISGVAHVAVDPICNSRHLLGVEGARAVVVGNRAGADRDEVAHVGHGVGMGHGAAWAPT